MVSLSAAQLRAQGQPHAQDGFERLRIVILATEQVGRGEPDATPLGQLYFN